MLEILINAEIRLSFMSTTVAQAIDLDCIGVVIHW